MDKGDILGHESRRGGLNVCRKSHRDYLIVAEEF
jgi:hypothetical protein